MAEAAPDRVALESLQLDLSDTPNAITALAVLQSVSIESPDFELPTKRGEKSKIKHPESFRATIAQIVNEATEAFLAAHSSTNIIMRNISGVPDNLVEAFEIILTEDAEAVELEMPINVEEVREIIEACNKETKLIEGKYQSMVDILEEAIESALSAKKDADSPEETERQKILLESEKKEQEEKITYCKKQLDKWEEKLETLDKKLLEPALPCPHDCDPNPSNQGNPKEALLRHIIKEKEDLSKETSKNEKKLEGAKETYFRAERETVGLEGSPDPGDKTLQAIREGIGQLNKSKNQWAIQAMMFKHVIKVLDILSKRHVGVFLKKANVVKEKLGEGQRKRLAAPVETAIAHVQELYSLSGCYHKISNKHIVPRVSSLSELIALTEHDEIVTRKKELIEEAKEAKTEIEEIMKENQETKRLCLKETMKKLETVQLNAIEHKP